ncbi:MAG TPA: ATP-binding cassette domain-containing protein, partial [Bdellovibrionales bacterium]|nr:ATP-binding cassette domain-containing protein [Bdellovibrionales bacterium]
PARWRWEAGLEEMLRLRRRSELFSARFGSAVRLFEEAIKLTALAVSVYLYSRGELTLGQVAALGMIVGLVTGPLMAVVAEWNAFSQVAVSMARIDDIMVTAPEADGALNPVAPFKGDIEFDDVVFQYGGELSPVVLNGLSLRIRPGETVAFVGASGSGKTTAAYMINQLYAPTRGIVRIDGADASLISKELLRSEVGMVMQENQLFSGSVLENIAIGDPLPDRARALEAARLACASEFVAAWDGGLDHVLGEGGAGLSEGQRQRLNLARALYRQPSILILDEATASLDSRTELEIIQNLKRWRENLTTIIVAHRLSTIVHADRIFVVKNGRVTESGTHTELVGVRGHYFELFRSQLGLDEPQAQLNGQTTPA